MKIHRKSGMASGEGDAFKPMIFCSYRGRQIAKRKPQYIPAPMTEGRLKAERVFKEISKASRDLPLDKRAAWAGSFRNLGDDAANLPTFMSKRATSPSTWLGAFFYSNLLAAHSGLSYPRLKAPLGVPKPPIPIIEARLDMANFKIEGKVKIWGAVPALKEIVLRIWSSLQYVVMRNGTLHQIINLGGGPIERADVSFSLDSARCAGVRFGVEKIALRDVLFGHIYIWADCVGAHGPDWAPLPSAYSNVALIQMPIRAVRTQAGEYVAKEGEVVSAHALHILNHVSKYSKTHYRQTKAKVIKIEDWQMK